MKVSEEQVAAACQVAARVYQGEIRTIEGIRLLESEHALNRNSAKDFIDDYRYLVRGQVFQRAMSASAMRHFMNNIQELHGVSGAQNAARSLKAHIEYYEGYSGKRMKLMRGVLAEFENNLARSSTVADTLVGNREEIAENLQALESARRSSDPRVATAYRSLIELGTCFVIYNTPEGPSFAPSKFVGYRANGLERHLERREHHRHGSDARDSITKVLGADCVSDPVRENEYVRFCASLGIPARKSAPFGHTRQFWPEALSLSPPGSAELAEFNKNFTNSVHQALEASSEKRRLILSKAPRVPRLLTVTTRVFERNPYVVAEVLLRAGGRCECCGRDAPFSRASDGTPYLEVHHEVQLAAGGEDTVENAIAVCPNCHREKHYG